MIQLTKRGTQVSYTPDDIRELGAKFRAEHHILLPRLIDPDLLQIVSRRLENAPFRLRIYEGIGRDQCPDDTWSTALLSFLCNNRGFFETIQAITECGHLGCFVGKVYRMVPDQGHYDSWHDDLVEHRRVALSINLSAEPYLGGTLEIRDRSSKVILNRIARVGFGDGIIFRLADHWSIEEPRSMAPSKKQLSPVGSNQNPTFASY